MLNEFPKLYTNISDSLNEMDNSLGKYKWPKLTQEEQGLNRHNWKDHQKSVSH